MKKKMPPKSKNVTTKGEKLFIAGIGASAGGLEALKRILPGLPADESIAYVIAQHMDPKKPSMLVSLLNGHTKMEVLEAQHGHKIEANKIYITPPGKDATISRGVLQLFEPKFAVGPKPSVDVLLASLAEDKGGRSVGIILSGTGSDGAHGIRAIKACAGITLAQDEASAKYGGMPQAAAETGYVDMILPPERIGQELRGILKSPHLIRVPAEAEAPDDIDLILQKVKKTTGADFSEYKLTTINRRIGRRMALYKVDSLADYIRYLEQSPEEIERLFKDILISVTEFFRDTEAFNAIKKIIPQMVESKKKGSNIRVWVPGCATGEEAYTIAILLSEVLGSDINNYYVQIFGTDLDHDAIKIARKGSYPGITTKAMDKDLVDKYFRHAGNTVQVVQSIREMIVFAKQDLTKNPPFSHLNLISCRNLLIYFNSDLQKKILPMFHYVLNPGGVLMLGQSESIGQFADLFTPMVKKWKIFKRRDTISTSKTLFGFSPRVVNRLTDFQKNSSTRISISMQQVLGEALARLYDRSAVLIDDRLDVVFVHGDVSPYLTLAAGDIGLNIISMAKEALRLNLRALIHKAMQNGEFLRSNRIKLVINGNTTHIVMNIGPVASNSLPEVLTLVTFEIIPVDDKDDTFSADETKIEDSRYAELEHELATTREHLQTVVEELETSNEELQSLNEELQSANEELQSSNEQLETSNEELSSTNEELTIVNEEFSVKSLELLGTNDDLECILENIGVAMLIVDNNLKVLRYTPPAMDLFSLSNADSGQVITTIPNQLPLTDFRRMLLDTVKNNTTIEQDIDVDQRSYRLRILPYLGEKDSLTGVMLIFLDRTDIKKVQADLQVSEERFRAIFQQTNESVVLIDFETATMVEFNEKAHQSLGYTENTFRKLRVFDLEPEENRGEFERHLEKVVSQGFDLFETRQRTRGNKILNTQISSRAVSVGEKKYIQSVWWRYAD